MVNNTPAITGIFDVVAKTLSSPYVAELQVTKGLTYDQAVVEANDSLRTMLTLFDLAMNVPGATPGYIAQMTGLKRDIQEYLKAVDLFTTIREVDYRTLIAKGDPSLFATTGSAEGVRLWGLTYADREGISQKHLVSLFTFILYAINRLTVKDFDFEQEVPEIKSVVPDVPSLEWVIDQRFRHDVTFEQAHIMGVGLLGFGEGEGVLNA
jgi:hypothetical protein